jgi:hypothetical protein
LQFGSTRIELKNHFKISAQEDLKTDRSFGWQKIKKVSPKVPEI